MSVKSVLLAAVAAFVLGWSTTASACDVYGSIVCKNDPAIGVSGIEVTVALSEIPQISVSTVSGTDGTFATHVNYVGYWYDVNIIPGTQDGFCWAPDDATPGSPIYLDPVQIDDPVKCPAPPPPPPTCTVTPPADIAFPYCPSKPIGSAVKECALFNLPVLDKVDASLGLSTVATQTAPVAIVKAGGCYSAFLNVVKDETVLSAPFRQGISHVTYCACPPQ